MSTSTPSRLRISTGIKLMVAVIAVLVLIGSCASPEPSPTDVLTYQKLTHWLSWNFYFAPSFTDSGKGVILSAYKDLLKKDAKSKDKTIKDLIFNFTYCPCDSFLTNMDVTIVGGSGGSISPPPTNPKTGPTGDYIVSNNIIDFQVSDSSQPTHYDVMNKISIPILNAALTHKIPIDKRILAIIDTGLDTAAFSSDIRGLLWKDSSNPTIYDVVPGHDPYDTKSLYDTNKVKHGTSAAALAISQITNKSLPKIMAIKAFDQHEQGSIYTVSCALSYAIQKKATFINASWGYFGEADSVLLLYVQTASNKGITIIAAAGNTVGQHAPKPLCEPIENINNKLQSTSASISHLFYPACFSEQLDNLVAINQLQRVSSPAAGLLPCFYQNYSEHYVNAGVLNNNPCCGFSIMGNEIEGSSFATPVVTGILMSATRDQRPVSMRAFVDKISSKYTGKFFTSKGNYFKYTFNFTIQ